MSSSIKDLIFDQDSTLFEVLDELDVPELLNIQSSVNTNTTLLAEYKVQLDALARKQDNFEATTTANFISVNTQIENLNNSIASLQTDIEGFHTSISRLDNGQYQLEQSVNSINQEIEELNASVTALNSSIETIDEDITTLNGEITSVNNSIGTLQAATFTGVKVLAGTQHVFMWDYANNRVTDTYLNLTGYMLMGVTYRTSFSSNWLSGDYDITLTCTRDSTTPFSGTSPVVSGQFYWFNWRAVGDTAWFHVQVYFYT